MKIFSAPQIRKADEFTLKKEPVTEVNLMERASNKAAQWIIEHFKKGESFYIFCGSGNNGGDGLAIARLLSEKGNKVTVFFDLKNSDLSVATKINLKRAKNTTGLFLFNFLEISDHHFDRNAVIIDALFGTGLNRKLEGDSTKIIEKLNTLHLPKISIDIPSGLFADKNLPEKSVVFQADHTLSFQFWKVAFLHPETGKFCGKIHILDIGLSEVFINDEKSDRFVIDDELVQTIYQPRKDFTNKGNFGKTLIIAGSFGKMGAAVLATKAALRSGSGITITSSPDCGYEILQMLCPEAMFLSNGENLAEHFQMEDDQTVGIGPGLGTDQITKKAFLEFLKTRKNPLVIDADALNILAEDPADIILIPKNSVITPHPKEFERLFGKTADSLKRSELSRKKAAELQIYIVLKDHHTQIITPQNEVFYNITGNSGMAKGGSGDVLLGIITSLLSQNYSPKNAAIFGVWLHGKAGDLAAEKFSKEAMLPTDLIDELGSVFKILA